MLEKKKDNNEVENKQKKVFCLTWTKSVIWENKTWTDIWKVKTHKTQDKQNLFLLYIMCIISKTGYTTSRYNDAPSGACWVHKRTDVHYTGRQSFIGMSWQNIFLLSA